MKPAAFEYHPAETVDEVLALLADYGDEAKLLAGGQSLVPTMNFRLAEPAVLIDLNRVEELFALGTEKRGLQLGAMVRQRTLEREAVVGERCPLLAETLPFIAHPQIRNRGTFGGSLAHADPAAELPAAMLVVEARLRLRRQGGERTVAAGDFFTGLFATALEPDELLAEVELPPPPPATGFAFVEVARRHGDFALVGVAAAVTLDDGGRCSGARIALVSAGEGPVRGFAAESVVVGESPSPAVLDAAAEAVDRDIDPPADVHASAAYRRHLARVLTARALGTACERAASHRTEEKR